MAINVAAIYHEAKSQYAYAFDKETVHIRIRTAKGDIDAIKLIHGDPFNWGPKKEMDENDTNSQEWKSEESDQQEMSREYSTDLFDFWFIAIKPKYRRTKYAFILEKEDDRLLAGCRSFDDLNAHPEKAKDLFNYYNYPFINPIDIFTAPSWVPETVWYQIFPERFSNGDKNNDPEGVLPWGSIENVRNEMFFGGDLEGVIQKLNYIKELGATGIYFTPIFTSPSTHKYDTDDYFQIDSQFGDLETTKRLVKEAHKRGIRVMLDAVFNHCGWNHPFFQDVVKNGEDSLYKDYFHIKEFPVFAGDPNDFKFEDGKNNLNFDAFAFTPKMPKWNTENEAVKEHLLKSATYWITECDIDAWRLDVSNEVDHAFWREFRSVCDKAKDDFFIVGENWDDSNPWLQPDQMQSVMNYEFMFSSWKYFGNGLLRAGGFKDNINRLLTMYPKNVSPYLFNLLDSHDTARIKTVCDLNTDKVKCAYVFQQTFGGTPSIYYGSEIGLAGGHDPDNRRCMVWDEDKQDHDLFNHVQKLIQLRKIHPAFKEVDLSWLDWSDTSNHIVYRKQTSDETIIVVINNQNDDLSILIPELENKTCQDLYSGADWGHSTHVALPPYGFLILKVLD